MSILVNKNTRVICQGITGKAGSFHTDQCLQVRHEVRRRRHARAGGTLDGKEWKSLPVFNTVAEAVEGTGANASMIFVPPPGAADAIMEAADAGITLIVAITEGVPVLDMARAKRFLKTKPGVAARSVRTAPASSRPAQCKIGIMPGYIHKPGLEGVGVISRSGTLTYEAVFQLTNLGLRPIDLRRHRRRPDHRHEPDRAAGDVPERSADRGDPADRRDRRQRRRSWRPSTSTKHVTKPVAAFIAGQTAPPGKRMGHAGAIISGGSGTRRRQDRRAQEGGHRGGPDAGRSGRRGAAGDCKEVSRRH